jgi:hypothetical protein
MSRRYSDDSSVPRCLPRRYPDVSSVPRCGGPLAYVGTQMTRRYPDVYRVMSRRYPDVYRVGTQMSRRYPDASRQPVPTRVPTRRLPSTASYPAVPTRHLAPHPYPSGDLSRYCDRRGEAGVVRYYSRRDSPDRHVPAVPTASHAVTVSSLPYPSGDLSTAEVKRG